MRKQMLLLSDDPVVSLSCLLDKVNVLIKFFLGLESHSVDPLEAIVGSFSEPIG